MFANIYLRKNFYSEYVKNFQNSIRKLSTQQKMAKDLSRHFIKEDIWMENKQKKRCSTFLVIGRYKIEPQ